MVTWDIQDDIATIVMDDGKANAMNAPFLEALIHALQQTRTAQAVVISGRSGFFSGGLDLKTLPGLSPDQFQATIDTFERLIRLVLEYPVPTVAAVAGHALAGGAVLLLACDQAIAGSGAYKIGLNEAAIGIPLPAFVMELARLRLQPRSWIRALALGHSYSVEEAAHIGYLDEVVATEFLPARAQEQARLAARVPNLAYQQTKALLHRPVLAVPSGQLGATISKVFLEGGLRHNLSQRRSL